MPIAVYFHPRAMTLDKFEETHELLVAAGADEPEGRLHHSCFGEDGDLMVYDIWESPESFEAFGRTLMPILNELGIDAGQPSIMNIHWLDQAAIGAQPSVEAR